MDKVFDWATGAGAAETARTVAISRVRRDLSCIVIVLLFVVSNECDVLDGPYSYVRSVGDRYAFGFEGKD